MARKRFTSKHTAKGFAKKVNGKLNDLRNIESAKSNFTVTYNSEKQEQKKENNNDWSPEEDRDFGYPNEYWY